MIRRTIRDVSITSDPDGLFTTEQEGLVEYIQIDSINDIDISKISLKDINKRYIDRNGLRYATRFNLISRKIEIVRIVKGRHEAQMVRQQIMREKKNMDQIQKQSELMERYARDEKFSQPTEVQTESEYINLPDNNIEFSESDVVDTGGFFEHQFMEECAADFERLKERTNGILNSVRNSKLFDNYKADVMAELFREFDFECIQKSERAVNYYKELISYPRPVSYYQSRLSDRQKKKLDRYETAEERLELIRRWEIRGSFESTYRTIIRVIDKLRILLKEVPAETLRGLSSAQRQAFEDARVGVDYLIQNCEDKLARIDVWKYKYE